MHKEYLKYVFVGGVTAFIYFGIVALGIEVMGLEYRLVVSVSYMLAVMFHFFANRKFTFVASDDDLWGQVVRYVAVMFLNYLITIGVVSYLVDFLFISAYAAAATAICATVVVGYLTSKLWVFNKKG